MQQSYAQQRHSSHGLKTRGFSGAPDKNARLARMRISLSNDHQFVEHRHLIKRQRERR
jgi:hypothetical protein